MIHIGNQTSYAAGVTAPFDFAVANGFDAFEWFPDKKPDSGWDERDLDSRRRQELREKGRAMGMQFSVHARWQANPFQPDSYPLFWKDLQLAQDLGAGLLNIHLSHEQGVGAFLDAIIPLAERVAAAGLSLSIENTPFHPPQMFNELFAAIRQKRFPSLRQVGMCLDLGHANLCEATRNRYLDYIDRLSLEVPLIHLHLHENWGDSDTHLTVFTGPSARDDAGIRGLLERLRRRKFSGSIILEQWPSPPSLLTEARARLLKMLNGSSKPAPVGDGATNPVGNDVRSLRDSSSGKPAPGSKTDSNPLKPAAERPPLSPSDGERAGVRGESLALLSSFASDLIAADKNSKSWREKLEAIQKLLDQPIPAEPEKTENANSDNIDRLIFLAIYLRFLGTGQIACQEDGRHFRPAHHARIAQNIRERVAAMTSAENAFIARKIYPWLPSSAQAFRRAEPLTRIRDIAHRNDIPSELKSEIKHSLQNKLHRCAGPEDLVTSTAILERISAPGASYSPAFVEQFKIFHEELKEFFNARSLEDLLKARLPKSPTAQAKLIETFLGSKDKTDLDGQFAALSALTELRSQFRQDPTKVAETDAQDLLMADLALENFAFVLLSQMLNQFDNRRDATAEVMRALLETLCLTLRNVALSDIEPEECQAIESEINLWSGSLALNSRDELLRLLATVQRGRRLAEDYSQRILTLFLERVQQLGSVLGVEENAVRVFCEGDIRGHIIFQLSKLASTLIREMRTKLALPPWDVLVTGSGSAPATAVKSLEGLNLPNNEPHLVLLQKAEGDEEIPKGVAGIVLARDLPHLSHLAVRARQAKVPFISCQDVSAFDELKKMAGKEISFRATAEKFEWSLSRQPAANTNPQHAANRQNPSSVSPRSVPKAVAPVPGKFCLPLDEVNLDIAGAKADNARRLAALARLPNAPFKVPLGLVVPFGVMETKLRAVPVLDAKYRDGIAGLQNVASEKMGTMADELRNLVRQIPLPDEILSELNRLGASNRFMVRSSSNLEDLAESAGAGLYESIPNVPISEVPAAVRDVWSSLWTRRAVLSRRLANINQAEARMAVLLQPMLIPEFSFVLHTVNPLNENRQQVYAEIALGLGETLVSGATRGSPYRLVCHKSTGEVQTLSFANFSRALRPAEQKGVVAEIIDYSRVPLSVDSSARVALGQRLAKIASLIEEKFGSPQDIEGAIVANDIWLVQARPQQGLKIK